MSPPFTLCLLLSMVAFVTGYSNAGSCVPEPPTTTPACEANPNNTFTTADPRNCRRYYICSDANTIQSPFPAECQPGEHYDTTAKPPVCTTTGKSCDLHDIILSPCIPNCIFEYPEPGQNRKGLAHRTDCNKYYDYMGIGQPIEKSCEVGEYYNGVGCQSDDNECCDPCMVYCQNANTYIADPFDCTKFYYCSYDTYFPDAKEQYSCPSGLFYDVWAHECSYTASCSQLCYPKDQYPPSL